MPEPTGSERERQGVPQHDQDALITSRAIDALFDRLQQQGELSQPVEIDSSARTPQTDEVYDDLIHSELFQVYLERPQRARAVILASRDHPDQWNAYRGTYMTALQSSDLNRQLHAYERMNIWHEGARIHLDPQAEAGVRFMIMLSRIPGFEPEGLAMEARGKLDEEIRLAELHIAGHRRLGNETAVRRDLAYIEELKIRALTIESAAVHLHRINQEENPPVVAKSPEQIAEETRIKKADKAFEWAINGTRASLRVDYAHFGEDRHAVDPYIAGARDRINYRGQVQNMVAELRSDHRRNLEDAFANALNSATLDAYIRDLASPSRIGLDRLQAIDEMVGLVAGFIPGLLEAVYLPPNWVQSPEDAAKVKALIEAARARYAPRQQAPGSNQGTRRY